MKRLIFAILLLASPAYAKICTENNLSGCNTLGYTATECKFGGIACPYDTTKWLCSKWSCTDGRYYAEPQGDYPCIQVSYKGLDCYDCFFGCKKDEVDIETCWMGSLSLFFIDCDKQGYTDTPDSCDHYIKCPGDENRVRCLD